MRLLGRILGNTRREPGDAEVFGTRDRNMAGSALPRTD